LRRGHGLAARGLWALPAPTPCAAGAHGSGAGSRAGVLRALPASRLGRGLPRGRLRAPP